MATHTRTVPFRDYETWAHITTPDSPVAGAHPLFVLHGGPGYAHDYVRNIAALANETGRVVVHYDQIGCGRSTHLPDAPSEFWEPSLFVDEFHAVRAELAHELDTERFHLLGQSWGGMLGAEIAVRQPEGLASLSICNAAATTDLWYQGIKEHVAQLSPDIRAILDRHEAAGSIMDPEYLAAAEVFEREVVCRVDPTPADLIDSQRQKAADPTVYIAMVSQPGTLDNWNIIDRLPLIDVQTLVIAGEFDEVVPAAWSPYVEKIPGARSHVFTGASHCTHLEQPEEFRAVVASFLAEHDRAVQG